MQSYGKSKFSAAQLSHHVVQAMLDAGEGQLLRHSFDAARQGKWLVVTLRAEGEEQIGVSSPLSTDGTE